MNTYPIDEDDEGNITVDFSSQNRAHQNIKHRSQLTEYGAIDLATGFPTSQIWVTRDGRRIAVPNMSDDHLINVIAFLRRRAPQLKRKYGVALLLKQLTITTSHLFASMSDDTQNDIRHEMSGDFAIIQSLSNDDFLREHVPIFSHLLQEAYKRKLPTN